MNRRTVLKGGIILAATAHTAAGAPESDAATERDLTWEEFATIEFDPWDKSIFESLPTNQEWIAGIQTVRLTSAMLVQTKDEIIEAFRGLSKEPADDDENLAQVMIEGMISTRDMLQAALTIIDHGIARGASAIINI